VDLLGSRAAIQATRYRASTAFAPVMDALRAAARS
jgi:hypothetical protein